MFGTIVNSVAIIIGCLFGLIVKGKISEKVSTTIMSGLGLCVLYIGISGALKGENTILLIISIAIGALIGEILDIDNWLNKLGMYIENKINKSDEKVSIAQGFVSASLLFCVGAMAIVGSLESGLNGNNDTLFAKSMLDFISAIIFTSSLGVGVLFSSIAVFLYQGTLTIGAGFLSSILSTSVISNMTCVGSILIIGLSLNILGVTKIKVANLLPAVIIPILFSLF
jgi:uncharacterized membrane protein YqgA involved in biofilm formation